MPAPMGERPIFVAARRGDGAFKAKRNLLGSEEMEQAALPMRQGDVSPNVTGTGTSNMNHTPCVGTSSQSNGTNSGANTFPNSSTHNRPGATKTAKGC
jgi:hypothetical protein